MSELLRLKKELKAKASPEKGKTVSILIFAKRDDGYHKINKIMEEKETQKNLKKFNK